MNVTAVTESIKKNSTNSRVKRSSSFNQQCPSKRSVHLIDTRDYFLHPRTLTDVRIELNEQIIWCEKALLAAASPILCQQLCQCKSNENLLVFEDIHLEEFLSFLEFIYPIFNPQINPSNISSLVKLAHRFEFNVLEHACQLYIKKYLSTIRHVCHRHPTSKEFLLDHSPNDDNNLQAISNKSDLIEFHDRTCIDASNIIDNLCQWLKIYFPHQTIIVCQSILNVLQQVSVDQLEIVLKTIDLDDQIKGCIYQQRAKYLESLMLIKRKK